MFLLFLLSLMHATKPCLAEKVVEQAVRDGAMGGGELLTPAGEFSLRGQGIPALAATLAAAAAYHLKSGGAPDITRAACAHLTF